MDISTPSSKRPSPRRNDYEIISILFIILLYIFLMCIIPIYQNRSKDDLNLQRRALMDVHIPIPGTKHQNCNTIHLATVCGGYRSSRDFYILLKSILFHRRNSKLHYHLFVDNVSFRILSKLFGTWRVPDLEISFYNMTKYEHEISWIVSSHYSNRYGMIKLLLPSILADKGLQRVIILDTDIVMLGDIKRICEHFSDLDKTGENGSFLGLVENQSDWYMSPLAVTSMHVRPTIWPALGRGFNTGLILLDLVKSSKNNWGQMWRDIAETELVSLLLTSLADQDIYNAVIKKHSRIVTKLPCHLNIQLNNHTNIEEACQHYKDQDINLIHWNSPSKLDTSNLLGEYFKHWYTTFRNWNGKLLEQNKPEISKQPPEDDSNCRYIRPRPSDRLRNYLYYAPFELDNERDENVDVTMVVHLSMDRFWAFEELVKHWPGPISAAIYIDEAELNRLTELIEGGDSFNNRKNIAYHLAFKDEGWSYPINRLRNIALENAMTPYVFLTDVDFIPSRDIYMSLKKDIRELKLDTNQTIALIVPAFEDTRYKPDFPSTKLELEKLLDSGEITSFRNLIWPKGQAQTDYLRWRQSTTIYSVDWSEDYEPYIVTSKNVARFDERFVGFGWNKVEHNMLLAAQGYKFLVLPDAFIIHQFHPASRDIMEFRSKPKYHACVQKLKFEFKMEIIKEYPNFIKVLNKTDKVL